MSNLPPFVALRSNFNLMEQFVANVKEGNRKGCLEMSSEAELVVNPIAKFAVQPSTGGLVHIRSCYNNKYWCSESESSSLIAAVAQEPVEDTSAWNCTLFRVEFWDSKVSFHHVTTNSGVLVKLLDGKWLLNVTKGGGGETGQAQYFVPVDTESIVRLPRRVTFKGDNDKYLRGRFQEGHEYNEFSGKDGIEKTTHYDIFYTENGDIRVKSLHYGMYWRRSPNWIWADSKDTSANNLDTLFEVVKVGDNVVALRNRGNGRFCKRLTTEGKQSCLNAAASSIEAEARLVVEEPVVSRNIEVQFRLNDARIYDKVPLTLASVTVPNGTNLEHEIVEGISYTKTHVGTWNNSISLTIGGKVKFTSGIPFIAQGELEVSTEVSETIQFGESNDFSKSVKTEYKVPVPPMTKVTVKVIGTEAKYQIPFSYIQTDIYVTGEKVTTKLEDGIYNGIEAYDFQYEATYDPL